MPFIETKNENAGEDEKNSQSRPDKKMVSQERRSIHIYKLVYLTERRSIQIVRLVNLKVPSIIKMYIVKIFIIKLYTRLYAQILLTSRQHLHDRITSPTGHVWVYRTSLPPPL